MLREALLKEVNPHTEKGLERLTGIFVSDSTIHELVNKTKIEEDSLGKLIEEICKAEFV